MFCCVTVQGNDKEESNTIGNRNLLLGDWSARDVVIAHKASCLVPIHKQDSVSSLCFFFNYLSIVASSTRPRSLLLLAFVRVGEPTGTRTRSYSSISSKCSTILRRTTQDTVERSYYPFVVQGWGTRETWASKCRRRRAKNSDPHYYPTTTLHLIHFDTNLKVIEQKRKGTAFMIVSSYDSAGAFFCVAASAA
jgi:hypothetical protein